MSTINILFIIIAALIGAIITYFLLKKKTEEINPASPDNHENEIQVYKDKVEEIQKKYESLLSEAQAKISNLDTQLNEYLNGHLDDTVQKQLAEVDNFKRRIKELEDEIEDNEDDLDDYKKKLKKKNSENDELQEQLEKELKNSKTAKEELNKLHSELENKRKDLELKMESLHFVQEIVSAEPVKDKDTKKMYSDVDNVTQFISEELKDCIKQNCDINNKKEFEDMFGSDLKRWAVTTQKDWIKGKTAIAFVGEFSAGKTSIVNRILSQDNPNIPQLPVSTKATTAIPTYISGSGISEGTCTQYKFITPDNIQKKISEDTFKRINKEVLDEIKGISSLIQYFVMNYKNDNLNNLSILDTPGFNSNDKEDAIRTIEVINECDALFWVFDVNAGTVNRASINLIRENLKKPLFVIINKVDTKAETEVNKVEQLIRKTLRDENISVQKIIRFSAKAPLSDIMEVIKSVPKETEPNAYLTNLKILIDNVTQRLDNGRKEAYKKQDELCKVCDTITQKYNRAINELGNNCIKAARIPRFEEHWFREDGYEMSINEYNNLTNLLDLICEKNVNKLCNIYNEQMEAQRKAQQAYSDYIDEKVKWQKMNNCKEQLEKVIKPFIR